MKQILLSTPNLSLDILDNLKECIETGWISTGGRFISEFEEKIAKYVGVEEAVSMQSGTAGLHTSLRVLNIGEEDEVIVPTLTFIAAVNPVKYIGAHPIFMDCDDSLCIDVEKLEEFLENECEIVQGNRKHATMDSLTKNNDLSLREAQRRVNPINHSLETLDLTLESEPRTMLVNKSTGKRVSAIIVVHVFGNLANMKKIMSLAEKYNLKVIEDATEALGSYYIDGEYKGKHAGTIGDIGVYSFNANKIITTGGGGIVVSKNKKLLDETRYLGVQAKSDPLYFKHDDIGYNYSMLNIQAAFGVDQIERLENFIKTKIRNYNLYKELLEDVNGLNFLIFEKGIRANHWFYPLLVEEKQYGINRDKLLVELHNMNIQARPLWRLIHKQKPYQSCQTYKIKKAQLYEERILNLPCSSNLRIEEVEHVCNVIKNII